MFLKKLERFRKMKLLLFLYILLVVSVQHGTVSWLGFNIERIQYADMFHKFEKRMAVAYVV